MSEALQPQTIQVLAVGKLLLFGVLALGWTAYARTRLRRWLPLATATVAAIFVLQAMILWPAATLWNRLSGDDLYVASFYQRVISDGLGHDFTYPQLPPHYPPLYFDIVGTVAGWLGMTGAGAAKLGVAAATFLVVPVVGYWWSRQRRGEADATLGAPVFALLVTLLPFITVDAPSVLTKPYEFISAIVALLWFVAAHRSFTQPGKVVWWQTLLLGAVGVALLTTYYLWLALAAIAGLLASARMARKDAVRYLARWMGVAAVAVLGAAWYWLPMLASYQRLGMENWLPAYFIPSDLDVFPPLQANPRSLLLWIGLVGIIVYRRRPAVRPAAYLLASAYLWQVISAVSLALAAAPFEPARGFTFLGEVILAYGAAYLLAEWLRREEGTLAQSQDSGVARRAMTRWALVWVGVAVCLPFGLWLDSSEVKQRINDLRVVDETVASFRSAFAAQPEAAGRTTLSFLPKLNAYVALPLYVHHNQHASHPAANFSRRLEYLRGLSSAQTPEIFARRFVDENPYEPIQQLILFADGEDYVLFFWLDDYPNGGREEVIRWPRRLIAEPYFTPLPALTMGGFYAWEAAPSFPR